MAEAVLVVALVATFAVVVGTWRRGRRRYHRSMSRLQQDMRRFHDDLHDAPTRNRAGRYRGPGQGWS